MIEYRKGFAVAVIVVGMMVSYPVVAADNLLEESAGVKSINLPETKAFSIDQITIKRGVTIGSKEGGVVVGIILNALSAPTTVTLAFKEVDTSNVKKGFTPPLWSVAISMDPAVEILRPFPLVLSVSESEEYPFIHRWDDGREQWEYQRTALSWPRQEVRTMISSVGTYAVLYDQAHHVFGRATWYPDRLSKDTPIAAASNEYPIGTKLKVTNVETHESVVVPVHSTGPYIKGRILDLTKSAFAKIGFPRKQGVLQVLIEPVGARPAFELTPRKKK